MQLVCSSSDTCQELFLHCTNAAVYLYKLGNSEVIQAWLVTEFHQTAQSQKSSVKLEDLKTSIL